MASDEDVWSLLEYFLVNKDAYVNPLPVYVPDIEPSFVDQFEESYETDDVFALGKKMAGSKDWVDDVREVQACKDDVIRSFGAFYKKCNDVLQKYK